MPTIEDLIKVEPVDVDSLTPLNYLAYVLAADESRKEQGLDDGVPVMMPRWLCTRRETRVRDVEAAEAWMLVNAMTTHSIQNMQGFNEWRARENRPIGRENVDGDLRPPPRRDEYGRLRP